MLSSCYKEITGPAGAKERQNDMAKFNTVGTTTKRVYATSPIGTTDVRTVTGEGASAHEYDDKSALFLLGVSNFVQEDSFYESGESRDRRFRELAQRVAVSDVDWFARFVKWLRNDANMRSASLVAAVDGAVALAKAGIPGGRQIVSSVLVRADEPGEALAYVRATYGRIPKPVKRGIADAAQRLYTERNMLKYDSARKGYSFGDVIELTHPTPTSGFPQGVLFKYAIDKKHSDVEIPEELTMLRGKSVITFEGALANPDLLKQAGLTWEAMSSLSPEGMSARVWESMIPQMGYMALLRNLRGMRQAGVSKQVLRGVYDRLSDPEQVARSRQLPMRFLSAYKANSGDLEAQVASERALDHSLANIPSLDGNTLILVDRSGSMFGRISKGSDLDWADSAALFGSALAVRAEKATLVQYGSRSSEVSFRKGDSILPLVGKFDNLGGTYLGAALTRHYNARYDRVIIITDEQDSPYYSYGFTVQLNEVSINVPTYVFSLTGNKSSSDTVKNRVVIGGGLTDASFSMIENLENAKNGSWPF